MKENAFYLIKNVKKLNFILFYVFLSKIWTQFKMKENH